MLSGKFRGGGRDATRSKPRRVSGGTGAARSERGDSGENEQAAEANGEDPRSVLGELPRAVAEGGYFDRFGEGEPAGRRIRAR